MPKSIPPLERALALFDGSPTKMAAAVGGGVLRQHVEHWLKSGRVPAEHCPRIEHATRELGQPVTCKDLRPDVPWELVVVEKART